MSSKLPQSVALALGLTLLLPALATAEDAKPVGEQLYDIVAAQQPKPVPGRRVNHIKGAVFDGTFSPSPEAASLSAAGHLQSTPVPMTIRFSNAGGDPDAPDNAPSASIRAMAFSFALPDGTSTDLMCINVPIFVAKTVDDFIAFSRAAAASGPNAPEPKPLPAYIAAHPEAKAFITTPKPMPVSYATQDYYAIHAYKMTNAAGEMHYVRFHVVPEAGTAFLTPEEAKAAPPNGLLDELHSRVAAGPVAFRLTVQVAEASDITDDPTVAWPASRKVVDLGRITVTKPVADNAAAEKKIGFLPNKAVKGLEPSDDPFLKARAAVYGVAYPKRQ